MAALGSFKAADRAKRGLLMKTGLSAGSGVADLHAQLGDFAAMVQVEPPPKIKIMLSDKETVSMISQALLMTADKINAGEPIDASRSIIAARRSAAHR